KQGNGVISRLRTDPSARDLPQVLHFLPVLWVGNQTSVRERMRERTGVAHPAAGVRLTSQRKRRGAWTAEVSRQKMHRADQPVGGSPLHLLVQAHGPQRHRGL